jgi:hypothetical protein
LGGLGAGFSGSSGFSSGIILQGLYDAESDVVVCCIRALLPPVLGETKAPAVEARRERSRHFIVVIDDSIDVVFVMVAPAGRWSSVSSSIVEAREDNGAKWNSGA